MLYVSLFNVVIVPAVNDQTVGRSHKQVRSAGGGHLADMYLPSTPNTFVGGWRFSVAGPVRVCGTVCHHT